MEKKSRGRGSYAKGSAKREQIIETAIAAFGRKGYHATSMREIAGACKLSQAGLLHYFPTKESLLIAIVAERDEAGLTKADSSQLEATELDPTKGPATANLSALDPQAQLMAKYLSRAIANQEEESLTRLWSNLAGEATDPAHPAHEYFLQRYRRSRVNFAQELATSRGHDVPSGEDQLDAILLIAIWDGLQTQWLIDEDFDMIPAFEYALKMFETCRDDQIIA